MSDSPQQPQLPRAPVLAYLTQTTTAARARQVAASATLVFGLIALSLALWLLIDNGIQLYRRAIDFAGVRGTPLQLRDLRAAVLYLRGAWTREWQFGLQMLKFVGAPESRACYVLLLGISGGMLVGLSRAVWRGSANACRWAVGLIVPLMLLAAAVTILTTALALVLGVSALGGFAEPGALKWILIFPPGLLILMLMKDLCAYLLWFARHPFIDKPTLRFLSGKPREMANPA